MRKMMTKTVAFPDDLWAEIKRVAESHDRSLSGYMREAVREKLQRDEGQTPPRRRRA